MRLRPFSVRLCCLLLAAIAGCAPADSRRAAENGKTIATRPVKSEGRAVSESRVTGLSSCAATGCHGLQDSGEQSSDHGPYWQNAYSIWASDDPHSRAFEVLYARRSVEIYHNLHPEEKLAGGSPDGAAYFQFLEKRCIGCHATAVTGETAVPQPGQAQKPGDYLSGVTCESCHGAGRDWLDRHFLSSWPKPAAENRRDVSRYGFQDTKNLHIRAETCVGCHVGPQKSRETVYDVNHDLIGAGHPRLTFEFNAYLANYPKHWHDADSGSNDFLTWQIGQQQAAQQWLQQLCLRAEGATSASSGASVWPEFATFDCFDCHHTIKPPAEKAASTKGNRRAGLARPSMIALDNWLIIRQTLGANDESAAQAKALSDLRNRLATWQPLDQSMLALAKELQTDLARPGPLSGATTPQKAAVFLAMLDRWQAPAVNDNLAWRMTWDEAVQFYLGLSAFNADLDSAGPTAEGRSPLGEVTEGLHAALADEGHFGDIKEVTQYDSPTTFDAARLAPALGKVRAALLSLKDAPARPMPAGQAGN